MTNKQIWTIGFNRSYLGIIPPNTLHRRHMKVYNSGYQHGLIARQKLEEALTKNA